MRVGWGVFNVCVLCTYPDVCVFIANVDLYEVYTYWYMNTVWWVECVRIGCECLWGVYVCMYVCFCLFFFFGGGRG